jgi:lipoate-protein ligase A
MPVFDVLEYWLDEHPHAAAENMAADQLLMDQLGRHPVLRIYRWSEPAVSFGYFHRLQEAREAFPATDDRPLTYVRRWTGGGIVDHRIDLTYTLAIPRECNLSGERGPESYRVIHQMLAETLAKLGEHAHLVAVNGGGHSTVCFDRPVAYDLTNARGEKIAGAGQRRTRNGLLHQGSLVTKVDPYLLGSTLAGHLASEVREWSPVDGFGELMSGLAARRYSSEQWLGGGR